MQTRPGPEAVQALRAHLKPVVDIHNALGLLEWDQETYMPPAGGTARAAQMATLKRIAHEMFTSARTRELLADAERATDGLDADSDGASLVRMVRRDFDQAARLPADFVAEQAEAQALAFEVWRAARPRDDFASFRPHLEKVYALARREADLLGYTDHPYDALLDKYEPHFTARDVEALFRTLIDATVPLVRAIARRGEVVDAGFLHGDYDVERQAAFGRRAAQDCGYDFSRGRLDVAPHPFATSFSLNDVRITTRYDPTFVSTALFSTLHEAGHAMYEQGVDPALEGTPIGGGASLGVHESQSRMWENMVGRSRPYWRRYFADLQRLFPGPLAGVDAEGFYRAVNRVEPSLIRIEADEVTYNLHIILRFELEKAVLEGSLAVADLPEAWDAKVGQYLGLTPPDDRDGVLQDIHWSVGYIGYFPTYTLGNVVAGQLFAAAQAAHPDLPESIGRGDFGALLGWLREHIHRHGRKFFPKELLRRATRQELSAEPYLRYLHEKFGEIYGLAPEAAARRA